MTTRHTTDDLPYYINDNHNGNHDDESDRRPNKEYKRATGHTSWKILRRRC